jgi:uncharacterized membrane protein YjjP (DUF1212 family)
MSKTLVTIDNILPIATGIQGTPKRLPYMAYEDQQQITRLCVRCGLLLMQYGAESSTVVDLCKRLGFALGVASVECSLAFNGITVTTIYNNRCITTLRSSTTNAINVGIIIQIQQLILELERLPMTSTLEHATERFDALDRHTYPIWLTAPMAGMACACFAYLAGGDIPVALVTFVAATVAALVRHWLTRSFFNPFVTALAAAFCGSVLSGMGWWLHIGNDPHIAIASSVVLLIPSFPLINSLSDMLKGYMNMGMGRFMFVVILTLMTCIGIVLALLLLGVKYWGFSG